MEKGKELEKEYEWLQASKYYKLGAEIALKENLTLRAAELKEKIGFCYYRAAFQAKTNRQFKDLLKKSIIAYENESQLLEGVTKKEYQIKNNHAKALVAYAKSWHVLDPTKRRRLLEKWYKNEKQVLREYEEAGNLSSAGKTCIDLIEYSNYNRFWLSSNFENRKKQLKEGMQLAEKAINIFLKLDNDYELARAYCFASWYYSFVDSFWESQESVLEFLKKSECYSIKALEISQKTGDAWLIGWSYISAWNSAQFYNQNPAVAIEYGQKALKFGRTARDRYVMGFGNCLTSSSTTFLTRVIEDPDKQKENLKDAIQKVKDGIKDFQIINHPLGIVTFYAYGQTFATLASLETDPHIKSTIIEDFIIRIKHAIKTYGKWKFLTNRLIQPLGTCLFLKSETKQDYEEKRKLLTDAEFFTKECVAYMEKVLTFNFQFISKIYFQLSLIQYELAKIENNLLKKVDYLNNATIAIRKCIHSLEKKKKIYDRSGWTSGFFFGRYYFKLGEILRDLYSLTKQVQNLYQSIKSFKNATTYFSNAKMPTHIAESYWHISQLYDKQNNYQKASENYELSARSFSIATKKIPQLEDFYKDYSLYMLAWSEIEQARNSHSIEDYEEAQQHYKKAANFHESTSSWRYLTSNYFAWAKMEEAEGYSRKENTQLAKQRFQEAMKQFSLAAESMKQRLDQLISSDEKTMVLSLLKASNLRQKYCQARILIEEAKILDREVKFFDSSRKYGEASKRISAIVDDVEIESERKELEYVTILCRAWEKMAIGEEKTSSEAYLEAARLFEKAKEHCFTRKASLWALGNSSFCKGLAAGINYQNNVDVSEHARAKSLMKSAETNYLKAGFNNASEYAKASQRLLDAYLYMNSAEAETVQDKRAKQYQMAENLLQIAAGSFMKAKQPEKATQLQKILVNVKEEKALAVSLSQVMKAPTIASTTMSFTAPSPTSEASVGLEQFQHANVQANLIVGLKEVKVGESFCLTIEFVNAGKEPALLIRVEDFVHPDFMVVKKPEIYRLEDNCLNMKGKQIAPLKLVEAKLVLQPSKKGIYQLEPTVHYLDEVGQEKSLQLKVVEIKVEEVILSDRVSTGTKELDSLLLGGIPKEYAVVLTGAPSDERELIIKNFLEAGIKEAQTSFYVTTEAVGIESLLEKPGFYLFLCNPKPKVDVPDLPNVSRLKSKTDLTNLNIALLKAYRNVEQSSNKRVCINVVSDVLVDYGVKTTRKWIAELTTDLVSKGFTVLAVINPEMHTLEQTGAVLDLFDGEINLTQSADPMECKKSLLIKKLRGQDYIKNPICLRT